MFSACSIPNTDISLDQNNGSKLGQPIILSCIYFFLVLHHDAYFPLTFGHFDA